MTSYGRSTGIGMINEIDEIAGGNARPSHPLHLFLAGPGDEVAVGGGSIV
jgi:hypothetical protein